MPSRKMIIHKKSTIHNGLRVKHQKLSPRIMLWISAAAVSLVPLSTNYFGTPYGEVQNGMRWKWPIPIKYIILSTQASLMGIRNQKLIWQGLNSKHCQGLLEYLLLTNKAAMDYFDTRLKLAGCLYLLFWLGLILTDTGLALAAA